MALAIDGTISSFANIGNASSISSSANLVTTNANDLIVVIACGQNQNIGSNCIVSSVTSASLSFRKWRRFAYIGGPTGPTNNNQAIEVWYAWAASAINETITINFTTGVTASTGHFFGVSGVDATYPFDETSYLEATNSDVSGSSTAPTVSNVATRETDTMIIAAWSQAGTAGAATVPTGYTQIRAPTTSAFSGNCSQSAYKIYSAAQSGLSIAYGTNRTYWGMVAFALVASGEGQAPSSEFDPAASSSNAAASSDFQHAHSDSWAASDKALADAASSDKVLADAASSDAAASSDKALADAASSDAAASSDFQHAHSDSWAASDKALADAASSDAAASSDYRHAHSDSAAASSSDAAASSTPAASGSPPPIQVVVVGLD